MSLVDMVIETGRKHQIRKHLAGAGFPIPEGRRCDQSCRDTDPIRSLVSCQLGFCCPEARDRKTFVFTARASAGAKKLTTELSAEKIKLAQDSGRILTSVVLI